MRISLFFTILLFSISCQESNDSQSHPRVTSLFNEGWLFYRGDALSAAEVSFEDQDWRELSLPHDWSIEDLPGTSSPLDSSAIGGVSTGFFVGGTSWYRKHFSLTKRQKEQRL